MVPAPSCNAKERVSLGPWWEGQGGVSPEAFLEEGHRAQDGLFLLRDGRQLPPLSRLHHQEAWVLENPESSVLPRWHIQGPGLRPRGAQ